MGVMVIVVVAVVDAASAAVIAAFVVGVSGGGGSSAAAVAAGGGTGTPRNSGILVYEHAELAKSQPTQDKPYKLSKANSVNIIPSFIYLTNLSLYLSIVVALPTKPLNLSPSLE